jgi:hypothetical protein
VQQLAKDDVARMIERAIDPEPGSALMTTAAEVLRHVAHIDRAFAAQAYAEATVGKLAEERCNLHP